jgi:3-isopropylmalate/(R)-2-methylmalate dehydratase large subunit
MLLKEKKLMLNLWVIWGSNKVKKEQIDYVLGSCTNGRIEDFRALSIVKGRQKSRKRYSMAGSRIACCGSTNNRRRILDILTDSVLYYVNPDALPCDEMIKFLPVCGKYFQQEFWGRQGPGSRTLLASRLWQLPRGNQINRPTRFDSL